MTPGAALHDRLTLALAVVVALVVQPVLRGASPAAASWGAIPSAVALTGASASAAASAGATPSAVAPAGATADHPRHALTSAAVDGRGEPHREDERTHPHDRSCGWCQLARWALPEVATERLPAPVITALVPASTVVPAPSRLPATVRSRAPPAA
jgi:hypothetical protein